MALDSGTPDRLLFRAAGSEASLMGNLLFEPYSRAVVDVLASGKRVRYLVRVQEPPIQWIDHRGVPVDAAGVMSELDMADYARRSGAPGGEGGFEGRQSRPASGCTSRLSALSPCGSCPRM